MTTDFFYKWTPKERAWAARHYDYVMSGDAAAWKAENHNLRHYKYVLLQALVLPAKASAKGSADGYVDMLRWYAAHPAYNIETAFLHQSGQPADSAHRLKPFGWDSFTWIFNPSDPGQVAYTQNWFQQAIVGEDGLFIDSQGSGDLIKNIKGSAEFPADGKWPPQTGPYFSAYAKLLATLKLEVGSKVVMLNTSGYDFAPDFTNLVAARATHMEKANNPLNSNLPNTWSWIDKLLAAGIFVDLVDALDYTDINTKLAAKLSTGSIDGAFERIKMAELASYYMVVPATNDLLALQLVNMWDRPYSQVWLKAQEANIGHPTGLRHIATELPMTDATGQQVKVFMREFDRALVIFRPQTGWGTQRYDDSTAVSISLPRNQIWLPLKADGSLGEATSSVRLRNAEAAIVIKKSATT